MQKQHKVNPTLTFLIKWQITAQYLLAHERKAGYNSLVNNGSGRHRRNSFNNAATSCGFVSSVMTHECPES